MNVDVIPRNMQLKYYIRSLYSRRLRDRSSAAHFLQQEELSHYPILPLLIRSAKTADQAAERYDDFLLNALRATAVLIKKRGFDPNDSLHSDALDWIVSSSVSENIEVAAGSIWALGDLGVPPSAVRDQLESLIVSDARRKNGDHPNTCRAVAFRMLARIDRETAFKYVGSAACREFRETVAYWLDKHPTWISKLRAESEWLENAG